MTSRCGSPAFAVSKLDFHFYDSTRISISTFSRSKLSCSPHRFSTPKFLLVSPVTPVSASANSSVRPTSATNDGGISADPPVHSLKAYGNGGDSPFDINAVEILFLHLF